MRRKYIKINYIIKTIKLNKYKIKKTKFTIFAPP